jgi:hypothetical protein
MISLRPGGRSPVWSSSGQRPTPQGFIARNRAGARVVPEAPHDNYALRVKAKNGNKFRMRSDHVQVDEQHDFFFWQAVWLELIMLHETGERRAPSFRFRRLSELEALPKKRIKKNRGVWTFGRFLRYRSACAFFLERRTAKLFFHAWGLSLVHKKPSKPSKPSKSRWFCGKMRFGFWTILVASHKNGPTKWAKEIPLAADAASFEGQVSAQRSVGGCNEKA